MKEIVGKMHQHNKSKLPRKLNVMKNILLQRQKFNEFFTEIGSPLARKIPTPSKPFERFLKKPAPPYLKDVLP